MDELSNQSQAIELLQKLGLKEYEAKCFVALSRLPSGTAKKISEISEVPRTRIYDAIRVLETKGLVEVQHSNPQQFRAVPIGEAVETLKEEYESRTESLRHTLQGMEQASLEKEPEMTHEVWSLSGGPAIANRTRQLVDEAESEVVLVVGDGSTFDEKLLERLKEANRRGVDILIGTVADEARAEIEKSIPAAEVFVSGLDWLGDAEAADDTTMIRRLLLVDRGTILVSTLTDATGDRPNDEQAVFGHGFDNGFVTLVRRLLAIGLFPVDDPATSRSDGSTANAKR